MSASTADTRAANDWAITYATLSMAAGYLYSGPQSAGIDIVQARIPHRYVSGPNHGSVEGKMWQRDQRLDAGGQEGILEAINEQVFHYEQSRHDALLNAWAAQNRGGVYLLETSEPDEKNVHFVFTDPRAIERIRFRSFLTDCRAIPQKGKKGPGSIQGVLHRDHRVLSLAPFPLFLFVRQYSGAGADSGHNQRENPDRGPKRTAHYPSLPAPMSKVGQHRETI